MGFNYSKWQIKVPGHTPILFGTFSELPKYYKIWPLTPLTYHRNTAKIQENVGTYSRNIMFSYHNLSKFAHLQQNDIT